MEMKYLKKFNELNSEDDDIIDLYYERYMKEYNVVDDYKGMGFGTIFGGDSGYCNGYDDFIDRLKYDLKREINDISKVEFIKIDEYKTFIKGYKIIFS